MTSVVVIGGTGLIGKQVVQRLTAAGHTAIPASPGLGVNAVTGEGLAEVLAGADVVVDVSNSPSFADEAVMAFFTTATGNLLAAAAAAGVGHVVALSVVGTERLPDSGYFRAKVAQERMIRESGPPYSLIHATQFFEFVDSIVQAATDAEGTSVRLAPVLFQPIAAADVANAIARAALTAPLNGRVEIAGPEQVRLDELVRSVLAQRDDPRVVISDPDARYFHARLHERALVPDDGVVLAETTYAQWLAQSASALAPILA